MVRRLIGALFVSAGLAACGNSTSTQTAAPSAGTAPHARSRPQVTTHRPHEVPKNRMPRHTPRSSGAEISGGFLVKAMMTITAGHRLSPPVIALPSHVTLKLTVSDDDGDAHSVAIGSAHVHLPAGGRTLLGVSNLKDGSYPVTVDGHPHGKVTVGSAGGP